MKKAIIILTLLSIITLGFVVYEGYLYVNSLNTLNETENVKLLKNYGLMHPEAIKPRPFYDLRQMLEGPAYYYFKKEDETDLIDVIVRVAIGKHREWIHNKSIDKF